MFDNVKEFANFFRNAPSFVLAAGAIVVVILFNVALLARTKEDQRVHQYIVVYAIRPTPDKVILGNWLTSGRKFTLNDYHIINHAIDPTNDVNVIGLIRLDD